MTDDMPWTTQQQLVLDRLQAVLEATRRQPVPRLVRVDGGTRTGKTALLMEIADRVRDHYGNAGAALIVATTHAAAAAVGGRTFNSAFMLPPQDRGPPGELRPQDRQRLRAVRVLLIDECNMVPPYLLDQADRRLRAAVGENGSSFGGRAVFAFGDFDSLGPIEGSQASAPSPATWAAFATVALDQSHMAESTFRLALERLAVDAITDEDARRFEARRLANLPAAERRLFDDVPRVVAGGREAKSYNKDRMVQERASLPASTVVWDIKSSTEPSSEVQLWRRAKVVLTSHIEGATAGDLGVVTALHLDESGAVATVSVRLEESSQVVVVPKGAANAFPLTAAYWATTLPRALGLHFTRVVVTLPSRQWEGRGVEYVYAAVARARGWRGLAFDGEEVPQQGPSGITDYGAGGLFWEYIDEFQVDEPGQLEDEEPEDDGEPRNE